MISREASSLPYQSVPHYGYYCKEKWETKKDRELPAPKFPMQTGDTPHKLPIPIGTTGTPKHKKTVLDAIDGYHSIPRDEESQPSSQSGVVSCTSECPKDMPTHIGMTK